MNQSQAGNSTEETPLRLVLVGRTGAGKSATGNTILGTKCFNEELSMSSVTKHCHKECGVVQGWSLALIDTPGMFDTDMSQKELNTEVLRCLAMCSPGPHAFLLIIPIAHFAEEQQQAVDLIQEVFKENIADHTIIIFTRADELKGQTIETFISEQDQRIKDVVERFGGRFLAFNNENPKDGGQVTLLLQKLDEIMVKNEYRHFTNQKTQMVGKAVEIIEKKKEALINEAIKKAKHEIRKIGEQRRAKIDEALKLEIQKIEKLRTSIQDKINQLNAELVHEYQTLHSNPDRLQQLQINLQEEKSILMSLEEMMEQKMKKSEEDKKAVDVWISAEEQRREQEERKNAERKAWYYNDFYFNILMVIVLVLGGAGWGIALLPGLFAASAAPTALAAQLTTWLGSELAATLIAAATKSAPLFAAARAVPGMCSIQ